MQEVSGVTVKSATAVAGGRDDSWREERLRLLVQATAETERQTLFANMFGALLIVGVAEWLPNSRDFHIPLLLRLSAILGTAVIYDAVRKQLARGSSLVLPLRMISAIAVFGGASWASLVIPLFLEPHLHPASYIVTAGVFIGVALIIANTSAIKRVALSFAFGFAATFLAALAFVPIETAIWLACGLAILAMGIGAFAIGSARQRRGAADLLVENRRLAEDLEEALARAEFFADHDPLTGLYNRRALFENEFRRDVPGERHHVLLIDLDNFKQINDRFGHETGDRVLVGVAQALNDFVRKSSGEGHLAARLGGEEFAVFLAVSDDDRADELAAQLHRSINEVASDFGLPPKLGTASIGISAMPRSEALADALQRADDALYRAKHEGRDRICREAA